MSTTSTTYGKISRVEVEFKQDASDPLYSFLQLRLFPHNSKTPHIIYIFPSDATTALDHLHNIFLACNLMADPQPQQEKEEKLT